MKYAHLAMGIQEEDKIIYVPLTIVDRKGKCKIPNITMPEDKNE